MKSGTCALCEREEVDLEDSHLIPKWVYKRMRAMDGKRNNAIHIHDDIAVQTSEQAHEHLLCSECEDRFQGPELYASEVLRQADGTFPAFAALGIAVGGGVPRALQVVRVQGRLKAEQLYYFALSIVWRAHACRSRPSCSKALGPKHGEAFRRFLLGGPRPDASLYLYLLDPDADRGLRSDMVCCLPAHGRVEGLFSHRFFLAGGYFDVRVGRPIGGAKPPTCLLRDDVIAVSDPAEIDAYAIALTDAHGASPRGKLAQRPRPTS